MRLKKSQCTACGVALDACDAVLKGKGRGYEMKENVLPQVGDISVCIKCGHIMGFAEDLTLRDLTQAEAFKVAGDPALLVIQAARARVFNSADGKCKHGIPRLMCHVCSTTTVIRLPDRKGLYE